MLKNIVFDLDGTLWYTDDAYVYAYNKACDYYGVTDRFPDETVKSYLGASLEKVMMGLFPWGKDEPLVPKLAIGGVCEYMIANPKNCCYGGVLELLPKLSEKYDIYIVSNCPKAFTDAFFHITKTESLIKGVYTLETGTKGMALSEISKSGKTLFVGDGADDYPSIPDHFDTLFCYAAYGYDTCAQYDYIIDSFEEIPSVIKDIEIKERQLEQKKYRVFSYGDNQLTLMLNPDNTAYFGYVKYSDGDFAQVIDSLLKEVKDMPLIGPINGNTFYPYRFATDNFDWRLFPDCDGGREVLDAFLNKGFSVKQEYVSILAEIDEKLWKRAQRTELDSGYTYKVLAGDDIYNCLEDVYEITVDSFADAQFYEPIKKQDFMEIYMSGLSGVVPDLAIIYKKDSPIAFCFCYEDPMKRFYVCKTVAVKKEYQSGKVIMKLTDLSYRMMEKRGYTQVLHHFKNLGIKKTFANFNRTRVKEKKYAILEYRNEK